MSMPTRAAIAPSERARFYDAIKAAMPNPDELVPPNYPHPHHTPTPIDSRYYPPSPGAIADDRLGVPPYLLGVLTSLIALAAHAILAPYLRQSINLDQDSGLDPTLPNVQWLLDTPDLQAHIKEYLIEGLEEDCDIMAHKLVRDYAAAALRPRILEFLDLAHQADIENAERREWGTWDNEA